MCHSMLTTSIMKVHIQQIGKRELRRAPALVKQTAAMKKKEAQLMQHYGIKAHL